MEITHTYMHAYTRAHTHTYARMHEHTHARTQARTRTRTHFLKLLIKKVSIVPNRLRMQSNPLEELLTN